MEQAVPSPSGVSDSATAAAGAEVYGNMTLSADCGLIDSLGTNLPIDLRAELASAFGVSSADNIVITNLSSCESSSVTVNYVVRLPVNASDSSVADAAAAIASSLSSHISSDFTSQWGAVTASHLEGIVNPITTQQQQEQKEQSQQQEQPDSAAATDSPLAVEATSTMAAKGGHQPTTTKVALITTLSGIAGVAVLVAVVIISLKLARARREMRIAPVINTPSISPARHTAALAWT
ncbi:hypothetical protein VOLCADRAFT_107367 [Volvox carteri f. nagariensis]|uniref:Uncharacterized protein n=1 Tax=Volvox carteri f. nagariensis TaxID=3068 RepID=D8UDJ8_VOLCA|nr:uncharacterized protein VOLCADRAFT_107367 [Volvox carteri f. nagariensis]EFJ42205.1 hypothetical protein VOLCADRAFT_107367 [Volvox carteri f. nagariensis]|eukprot:XP_002956748.1 hypothetical protein VOLCADRAFT_107367 [Volvox carteri f. nagariensis]